MSLFPKYKLIIRLSVSSQTAMKTLIKNTADESQDFPRQPKRRDTLLRGVIRGSNFKVYRNVSFLDKTPMPLAKGGISSSGSRSVFESTLELPFIIKAFSQLVLGFSLLISIIIFFTSDSESSELGYLWPFLGASTLILVLWFNTKREIARLRKIILDIYQSEMIQERWWKSLLN